MISIRKIGLLDINESMEFLKLKDEFTKFMEKIVKSGGEQSLYNTAKSKPFSVAIYLNETEKLMKRIDEALDSYAKRDMYVSKELGQMKAKLVNLKENLKTH